MIQSKRTTEKNRLFCVLALDVYVILDVLFLLVALSLILVAEKLQQSQCCFEFIYVVYGMFCYFLNGVTPLLREIQRRPCDVSKVLLRVWRVSRLYFCVKFYTPVTSLIFLFRTIIIFSDACLASDSYISQKGIVRHLIHILKKYAMYGIYKVDQGN